MRTAAHIIETVGKLVKKYDTRDPYELCKCLEIKIHFYNLEKKLKGFFFYQSRQKNKDFDIDCLRGQISIVSQNIFLLNDTIYNNIVLGKEITDEELQHILVQAGLHEFINTLPNKLETVVGENGIKLSGGEKQRISIARALLKKNPILIFDEATSMLDNETEEKIISILLDSFKDTTIILIAHRLSTVKNANTIYVLNNGTIMEHGNHDQLLEQKGIYYHLYNI